MKRTFRIVFIFLMLAVFLFSAVMLVRDYMDKRAAEEIYEQARDIVAVKPTPTPEINMNQLPPLETPTVIVPTPEPVEPLDVSAEYLLEMDIESLRRTNEEVVGWIVIPDTVLDYPLMKTDNNSYYLSHAWDRQSSNRGSIFFDYQMKTDFSYFNTIIYGHNMKGGSMFNTIRKMDNQSFWEEHPIVYIVTDDLVRRFEIFAAFEAEIVGPAYWLGELNDEYRQIFLDYSLSRNVLDTGIVPEVSDTIVTLSTCTGTGQYHSRWIAQAVLTGEFER